MLRMILRKFRKVVEIDIDDLVDGWWYTRLCHDYELVWSEFDSGCDLPVATFMCENHFTWEVWKLDSRCC